MCDEIKNIVDGIINEGCNNGHNYGWHTRTFYLNFIEALRVEKNGVKRKVDGIVSSIYYNLCDYLHPNLDLFANSQRRGRLRGFQPVTQNTINAVLQGHYLEVALERSLSKYNRISCQFSCLAGFPNGHYNRKSIDLVNNVNKNDVYLVELKKWDGASGHPLYAAIEIMAHFFCLLIVRRYFRNDFPQWTNFKLRIMAPQAYFNNEDEEIARMLRLLNDSMQKLLPKLRHRFRCYSVNLDKISLNITQEQFIDIVRRNQNALLLQDTEFANAKELEIPWQ